MEMALHPPFREVAVGARGIFGGIWGHDSVHGRFLKTEAGMSETRILLVTSMAFPGRPV